MSSWIWSLVLYDIFCLTTSLEFESGVAIDVTVQAHVHGENLMAIFITLRAVIFFSTGTLEIFATLVYVFTMRVVIYDILSMTIIPTLSTSVLVICNLCYILLWISPRSMVKSPYGYSKLCNINAHKKNFKHCLAIFTIHGENFWGKFSVKI